MKWPWTLDSDLVARRRRVRIEAIVTLSLATLAVAAGRWCPAEYGPLGQRELMVWWLAFLARTLEMHVGLLVAIVACLCVRDRLWGLAALAVPLLVVTLGADAGQLVRPRAVAPAGGAVRVMSVNTLMVNKHHDGIVGEIVAAQPDLLMVQELTDPWYAAIDAAVKSRMPHCTYLTREDSFGIGIWSTRPFVGEPERHVKISYTTPQLRAVVDLHGVPHAIYNVHLLPPRSADYTRDHRAEMGRLAKILADEKLPVILGGDFNFTEKTPQAATMARLGFVDAQDQGGTGRGATWPVIGVLRYVFPGIRLDHVWLRGGPFCRALATGEGAGSDHRPIVADLVVPGAPRD